MSWFAGKDRLQVVSAILLALVLVAPACGEPDELPLFCDALKQAMDELFASDLDTIGDSVNWERWAEDLRPKAEALHGTEPAVSANQLVEEFESAIDPSSPEALITTLDDISRIGQSFQLTYC